MCRALHFGYPIDTGRYIVSIPTLTHNLEYIRHVVPTDYGEFISKTSIDILLLIDNLTILEAAENLLPMDRSHTVAIIHLSNNVYTASYSFPNLILDTQFPAMKPVSQEYNNNIFGR